MPFYLWKSKHKLRLSWVLPLERSRSVLMFMFEITKIYRRPSLKFPGMVIAAKAALSIDNAVDNIWKIAGYTQLKILSISSVADGRMKQKSDFSVGFLTRRLATNKTSCIVRGLQYTIMCDFRSAITA